MIASSSASTSPAATGRCASWRGPPPLLRRDATAGGAGAIDGSQTSQHGPSGSGSRWSPKWLRMPRRRQAEPSTQAHTARYWRHRARVPSCAAERQSASARPSQLPLTLPRTRSGADGLGWTTPERAR